MPNKKYSDFVAGDPASTAIIPFETAGGLTRKTTLAGLSAIEDAAAGTILYPTKLTRTTTHATPANGIGVGLQFEVETSAANNEIGAVIEAVTTDVTATSEDFDLVFKTQAAGATAAERLRILSTGEVSSPANGIIAYRVLVSGQPVVGVGRNDSIGGLNLYSNGATADFHCASNGIFQLTSTGAFAFCSGAINSALDTGLARQSAGVIRATDGTTGIRAFLGGGAAVASAAALPLPTGRVFHVTGTTNITSITSTNFQTGAVITIIFDGILTFTDGSNLKLAGNFVTTADDTITLVYDGTNWFETSRSVN